LGKRGYTKVEGGQCWGGPSEARDKPQVLLQTAGQKLSDWAQCVRFRAPRSPAITLSSFVVHAYACRSSGVLRENPEDGGDQQEDSG
jgi:hypothetical protein